MAEASTGKGAPAEAKDDGHVQFLPLEEKDRYSRFLQRQEWRKPITKLPLGEFFEIPGRPHVCYCVQHYGAPLFETDAKGAKAARDDFNFLFKAFETGQTPPHRLKKKGDDGAQPPTIHQYLDWTVTAREPEDMDDYDFGGFRTVLLYQRHRPTHPPPGVYDESQPPSMAGLGCPLPPLPRIIPKSAKPVCVATVRCGGDYLEVPFFATSENHRGRGYGRALVEALEQIGRTLKMQRFLLCSTDDTKVRSTWSALGFEYTTAAEVRAWDVRVGDLVYMTNTVQMHKAMPPARPFRAVLLTHGAFRQRLWLPEDGERGAGTRRLEEAEAALQRKRRAPSKSVVKKVVKKVARATAAVHDRVSAVASVVASQPLPPTSSQSGPLPALLQL